MRLQQLTLAAFVAALAVGCSSTEENDKKGGGGGGGGGNQVLDDLYKDLGLRDKEKRALAEHYFKVGKQYYDQLDYAEAAKNFQKAQDADPNDKRAQQYYLM